MKITIKNGRIVIDITDEHVPPDYHVIDNNRLLRDTHTHDTGTPYLPPWEITCASGAIL